MGSVGESGGRESTCLTRERARRRGRLRRALCHGGWGSLDGACRGADHVEHKYLFGRPIDQIGGAEWVPGWIRFPLFRAMLRLTVGPMENYGLPRPDRKFAHAHPTISGRILDRLAHGAIVPQPNIAALEGDRVRFADGTSVHADLVVYSTGYRISFPFLDPEMLAAPATRCRCTATSCTPDVPGLYFVGLVQPLGAIMPIAERQSELIADHVQGRYAPPDLATMLRSIRRERAAMRRRYVASPRHTIQVDYDDYMRLLRREREAGARAETFAALQAVKAAVDPYDLIHANHTMAPALRPRRSRS